MLIKVAIMGTGRMGTLIREAAEAARTDAGEAVFEVVAQVGFELGELDMAPAADVMIDFSNASTLDAVAAYVRRCGCALVCGTTGYTPGQVDELRALGQVAPVIQSGNYSLGVAALRHASALVARELPGFDIEITECHHNQKVDAPSGTAALLFDAVNGARGGALTPVYGRHGQVGARNADEVGMHSLRGGTVPGVHTVSFFGTDEEVSLTHRATSRQIFVTGAIAAARKIVEKPAGFYTFDELMFGA